MLKWKKPVSKGHVLYDTIYRTFWKGKTIETEKIGGGPKLVTGGEKLNTKSTKRFWGEGAVLYLDCGDDA